MVYALYLERGDGNNMSSLGNHHLIQLFYKTVDNCQLQLWIALDEIGYLDLLFSYESGPSGQSKQHWLLFFFDI